MLVYPCVPGFGAVVCGLICEKAIELNNEKNKTKDMKIHLDRVKCRTL